jgi:hypothetical protein
MPETDLSNPDFQLALQFVNQTARHIFLTGEAGTGKTTFLRYIREHSGKKMVVLAPTGVAAINAGGVTLHSFFQLPFVPFIPGAVNYFSLSGQSSNEQALLASLRFSRPKRDLLQELDLVIIDEVSMLRADMLDAMDAVLRHYRNKVQPFGGVQVVFIGDLHQLPPVVNKAEWELLREHYQSPFFFDACVLKHCPLVYISLKKIYRQKDAGFISLLNSIRNNRVTEEELTVLHKRYDPYFQPGHGERFITLTTHNARADAINRNELEKLPGHPYSYEAEVSGDFDSRSVTADHRLLLKKGAQVMFVKNDKGENRRYFNGKIGVVTRISEDAIRVGFPGEEGELEVEKETWKNIRYHYNREKGTVEEETIGSFTQYPLRLAWAITIHKSQGLTFERACIDAGASFAPGQVYVALSRLTTLGGLVLFSPIHRQSILTDPRVMVFSQSEEGSVDLQEKLQQEQASYVLQLMEEAFQWNKISTAFRSHYEGYGDSLIKMRDLSSDWAKRMLEKVEEESVVCDRFGKQLRSLLAVAKDDGYQSLQPRIAAACKYFLNVVDLLTASLEKRKRESKKTTGSKKYVKELSALEKTLQFKKLQLNQALRMGEGLVKGIEVSALFDILQSPLQELVADASSALRDTASPDIKEKKTGTVEKLKKGATRRISLDLYRENKAIPEIAKLRGLAPATIENHLASFIATGEMDLKELVPEGKIEPILAVIRESGDSLLSPLKEKLGEGFSYLEIKAVKLWLEASERISVHSSDDPAGGEGELLQESDQ